MAFEYVGLASSLKPVSAAFENPFGLEHLATAQQNRDQSKAFGPIRVAPAAGATLIIVHFETLHPVVSVA